MSESKCFRDIVNYEMQRLEHLCERWKKIGSEETTPQEETGLIMSVVGQTKLLLSEKFKQFDGLIEQSKIQTSDCNVTKNDLEGFWELILLQIRDVDKKFETLEDMRLKNWKKIGVQ